MNNVIASVVNRYNWPPDIVGGLFYDRVDYKGIEYWYDQVKIESDKSKAT